MLNRTSIEEANKHLQALYSRVSELESVVQEQHDALVAKDSFIQTKIQELVRQDLVIQELRQKLEDKERELVQKNTEIKSFQTDRTAKEMQISVLQQKCKALNNMMDLIPDMKTYVMKMEAVAKSVKEIDTDGYVNVIYNVSESPSLSEDGIDNTDGDVDKTYNSITQTEDVYDIIRDETVTVKEMARSFAKSDRGKKFSVSEDDDLEEDADLDGSRNNSSAKEVYF